MGIHVCREKRNTFRDDTNATVYDTERDESRSSIRLNFSTSCFQTKTRSPHIPRAEVNNSSDARVDSSHELFEKRTTEVAVTAGRYEPALVRSVTKPSPLTERRTLKMDRHLCQSIP